MLTRIQARNYRCLKHVDQTLSNFDVLVGGNGVGKSTFLDVISFLSEIVSQPRDSLANALQKRAELFDQLLFDGTKGTFELAIEATIPSNVIQMLGWKTGSGHLYYRIAIGYQTSNRRDVGILSEKLLLTRLGKSSAGTPELSLDNVGETVDGDFIDSYPLREFLGSWPIISRLGPPEETTVFHRESAVHDNSAVFSQFRLSPSSSAFANLPEDTTHFPAATWFRRFLGESVVKPGLTHEELRHPGFVTGTGMSSGEFNLAERLEAFKENRDDVTFEAWLRHLRIAVPDLETIITVGDFGVRSNVVLVYNDGRRVPSWLASDGTLRLIALTLIAYTMDHGIIILIEEPENCIHPLAIEIVMQSLSSMYESQVFVTTHSPAILSLVAPRNILCFSKSSEEGTMIVRGDHHPRMSAWKGTVDPGMLLASGILG